MTTTDSQPDLGTDTVSPLCRGCGEGETRLVMDLGPQPAADDFPSVSAPEPDAHWPLTLRFCPTCALVQLGPVEVLLEEPVLAVESRTHREHAARAGATVLAEHTQLVGRPVREFASHHGGSWLPTLAEHGCEVAADGEPAALVVDVHGLAHEPDVGARLAERAAALQPDGLLMLEFHHLLPLVQQGQFDTIRHGHWSYLSLTAVDRLASRHGLIVVKVVAEDIFGGSLRVVLARQDSMHLVGLSVPKMLEAERMAGLHDGSGLEGLADRAAASARELAAYLEKQRADGRRVLGYGAPSKAAVLLGLSGVGTGLLEFTVDAAPLKHGLAIPGVRVPIRPVADLVAARPPVVLILTWDIADEVIAGLEQDGGWGAEYVVPLPTPRVLVQAGTVG